MRKIKWMKCINGLLLLKIGISITFSAFFISGIHKSNGFHAIATVVSIVNTRGSQAKETLAKEHACASNKPRKGEQNIRKSQVDASE